MTTEEAIAMRKIHAILVRHEVDTAKLDINVNAHTVELSGELRIASLGSRSIDPTEAMTAVKRTCLLIEQEIRRIGGIHDIYWRLRNWEKVGTRWAPRKA